MIIGCGYKARSGKDTVANYLVNNHSFVQESFAFPLKEYIGRQICGFTEKQLWGSMKETIDPEWGMTPRKILQLVGTDALRNVVSNNFWIIPMKRKLKDHIRNGRNVVVSDVRFVNEIELIKELSGKIVKIERNNLEQISGFEKHSSEFELETFDEWDYYLDNNGTLEDLYKKVDNLINDAIIKNGLK